MQEMHRGGGMKSFQNVPLRFVPLSFAEER